MSGLFLPPVLASSFINDSIEMEEALFIEKQREQGLQQNKPTSEPQALLFCRFLPYIFVGILIPPHLHLLLNHSIPSFLLFLKCVLTVFLAVTAINLIPPDPSLKQQAPRLLKAQKLLFKGAVAATLLTHFVYAISTPSPINIATALVMLTKSLGETYIDKATIKYVKQFPYEKRLAIFSKISKQQMDKTNPDSIKYILCFSVLKLILSIAVTTLYVFAPTETNPIKQTLVSLLGIVTTIGVLHRTIEVAGTVKAFIQERQETVETS